MALNFHDTFREFIEDPIERYQKFFLFYCDVQFSPSRPIGMYMRSGKELLRMGNIYYAEKDYFHAFVLYSRYIVLYIEKLKTHPKYGEVDKTELNAISKAIRNEILPRSEKLKAYIKDAFQKEAKEYAEKKLIDEQNKKIDNHASSSDFDSIKHKINQENEQALELLKMKEWAHESTNFAAIKPSAPPLVDRSVKPKTSTGLSNQYNLRIVSLPGDTTRKFLNLAEANTQKNVETCGILAGQLKQNKFFITHCIIPKQHGTSETCNTEHEHELFDIMDHDGLITLGWIHTVNFFYDIIIEIESKIFILFISASESNCFLVQC